MKVKLSALRLLSKREQESAWAFAYAVLEFMTKNNPDACYRAGWIATVFGNRARAGRVQIHLALELLVQIGEVVERKGGRYFVGNEESKRFYAQSQATFWESQSEWFERRRVERTAKVSA